LHILYYGGGSGFLIASMMIDDLIAVVSMI